MGTLPVGAFGAAANERREKKRRTRKSVMVLTNRLRSSLVHCRPLLDTMITATI